MEEGSQQQQLLSKVVQWIDEAECSGGSSAQDPLVLLHRLEQAEQARLGTTQRWMDLHRSKYNSLNRACRALFDVRIDRLARGLSLNLGAANADDRVWRRKLSSAVVAAPLPSAASFDYARQPFQSKSSGVPLAVSRD
mmetsp:Transcript_31625/g.75501  ORF Transcript_31625/g.75501 Transcript_31625/m.75501 type:complete len:138 (-) Transcript_31625:2093-2506(-)